MENGYDSNNMLKFIEFIPENRLVELHIVLELFGTTDNMEFSFKDDLFYIKFNTKFKLHGDMYNKLIKSKFILDFDMVDADILVIYIDKDY